MTAETPAKGPDRYRAICAAMAVGLALFAIVLFHGAASNEFIWDDPIVFGRQIPYFDSLQNVFFPPRGKIPQFGVHYYRPATIMTYQLDEKLVRTFWSPDTQQDGRRFVYHASVVVYHGIASALVFMFGVVLARACSIARTPAAALSLSAGVLFAVHPIHVECVAWMAGRTDILCAILVLSSGIFYLRSRREGKWLDVAAFAACSMFAMLTKETGLAVVPFALALELFVPRAGVADARPSETRAERRRRERKERSGKNKKRRREMPAAGPRFTRPLVTAWVLLAVAATIYLSLRKYVLGNVGTRAAWVDPEVVLSNLFGSLGWYSVKAVFPPPQSAFVGATPAGGYVWVGVVVLVASGMLMWRQLRKGGAALETVAVALGLAAIALPLITAVRNISETPVAERYLYIPTAGVCLLFGSLLVRAARRWLPESPRSALAAVAVVTVLVAVPASIAAIDRASVWRNNFEFWEDAVAKAPDQGLPHLHLGITYADMNDVDRAIELYEQAFEKYDDAEGRSKALNNKASALMRQQKFAEAIVALRQATKEVPGYATAHYNWGVAEKALAQQTSDPIEQDAHIRAALTNLKQALEFNPRYPKAHLQLGELYILIGQRDVAVGHLNEAVRLEPNSFTARRGQELLRRLADAP